MIQRKVFGDRGGGRSRIFCEQRSGSRFEILQEKIAALTGKKDQDIIALFFQMIKEMGKLIRQRAVFL